MDMAHGHGHGHGHLTTWGNSTLLLHCRVSRERRVAAIWQIMSSIAGLAVASAAGPCHRRLTAACFFGSFLRSNGIANKNASAQTVKQSNAGGGTRSIGACTQLLYRLHALDCLLRSTLTRPGNQGGEHRSFGRRGALWHPGDACTPGQATRERGGAGYLCEPMSTPRCTRCAACSTHAEVDDRDRSATERVEAHSE